MHVKLKLFLTSQSDRKKKLGRPQNRKFVGVMKRLPLLGIETIASLFIHRANSTYSAHTIVPFPLFPAADRKGKVSSCKIYSVLLPTCTVITALKAKFKQYGKVSEFEYLFSLLSIY
jgi:hypothetical protein